MILNTFASLNLKIQNIKIINEKNIFEYIPMGHPIRPQNTAILFVKKGCVLLKEHVSVHSLESNSIIIIDTNRVYEVLEASDEIEILLLVYERSFLDKIALKLNKIKVYDSLKKQLKRIFNISSSEMDIIFTNLKLLDFYLQEKKDITYIKEIVEHLFMIVLYHIVSVVEENNEDVTEMTRNQQIVNDFILLVSDYYLQTKSVQFYADKLHITSRYLSSVVKLETNKTPNDFITEFILNEAKAQLSTTNKAVKVIARDLQFSDQYSFSHFFKKHLKLTPLQYRKQFKD